MYEQLTEILADKFQVPVEDIEPSRTLEDLGLDSLDLVELALAIEREFEVRITDDDLAETSHLGDVAELVAKRRAAA